MRALDASALLAHLLREPGGQRVGEVLAAACMSTVNLAEVLERLERAGLDSGYLAARLRAKPIEWVEFSAAQAAAVAALAALTRPLGLSLGDRACLALARERGIPAVTADRAWRKLAIGVEIESVR